jgi:chromosome partitioning protein
MTILAVVNRKGGVGKTTVALAVATRLGSMGRRVLVVDLDSQANATEACGVALQPGVYDWLGSGRGPVVVGVWGMDLVPGNATTERVSLIMASEGDLGALDRALGPVREGYDWVVLDCAPSMSMLTRGAVYASDFCLCPTRAEYLAVAGVRQLTKMVARIRKGHRRDVRLMGILPNMYDRRTREHKENLKDLVRKYGRFGTEGLAYVWPPLRSSIAVASASARGVPLWEAGLPSKAEAEWVSMVERVAGYG